MANYKDIKYDFSGENLTALDAANIGSNKVPTARLGSGTASSSTVLYGDQTYKTEPSGITQTSFLPTAAPLIINGDMQISQRATSVASVSTLGYRACDRWLPNPQSFGTWTVSQDSDSPDGFHSSYKFDCTTANASPAATGQIFQLQQRMEGQNLQVFEKGTSTAKKYTVAFWIKSTVTGTFNVNIQDNDNSRNVSTTWTVDAGDTWEKKICNLPADTTGALDNDNASSMQVQFHFGASAGYAATDSTSWGAHGSAGLAYGVTGNMASSTSNNFYITGVQLEVGEYTSSDLPPFRHESFGDNLIRCMRYYENNYKDGEYPGDSGITDAGSFSGFLYSTDFLSSIYGFKVRKRANPTMTFYDRNGTAAKWYSGVYQVSEAIDDVVSSINQPQGFAATCSGVAANTHESHGFWTADSEM